MPPSPPYGRLTVRNGCLTGTDGQKVSLAGVSFFWSQWMGQFFTAECVRYFADTFKATLVRAPLGVHKDSGYLHDRETEKTKVYQVVDAAIQRGLYVIIDWHSHEAHKQIEEAAEFFRSAAQKYGSCDNVIYEIWNEPLNVPWGTIKSYAERIIAEIRLHDRNNLVVVGTPKWSQCVDEAVHAPLGDHNVAYALHFYAGTHGGFLRQRAERAISAGLCLFVSEWGAVNANGDGAVHQESVNEWMDFLREHQLSHAAWSVSNKAEGASFLKPHISATPSEWTDDCFTESGCTIRTILQEWSSDNILDVWWPNDGVKVDGVQPWKVVLKKSDGALADVDDWEAWWRVDGGQRNSMCTAVDSECPHKVAMCDVSSWNWRGIGPYVVKFEARVMQSGATITTSRRIYTPQKCAIA
eukprot:TRINITY_DN11739_c0_g1_i1.p1 TRINITY_DN11739_c0_g1~~TRINITY_DN11739_c0_g1_i1.p1  ORF type:complete len:411 (-),score=39.43 TRINITY_DN11739_c0_g1_i1:9-1241(-)